MQDFFCSLAVDQVENQKVRQELQEEELVSVQVRVKKMTDLKTEFRNQKLSSSNQEQHQVFK